MICEATPAALMWARRTVTFVAATLVAFILLLALNGSSDASASTLPVDTGPVEVLDTLDDVDEVIAPTPDALKPVVDTIETVLPMTDAVIEPVIEPVDQAVEPVIEPVAAAVAPAVEVAVEPAVVELVIAPVVELAAEPMIEPITQTPDPVATSERVPAPRSAPVPSPITTAVAQTSSDVAPAPDPAVSTPLRTVGGLVAITGVDPPITGAADTPAPPSPRRERGGVGAPSVEPTGAAASTIESETSPPPNVPTGRHLPTAPIGTPIGTLGGGGSAEPALSPFRHLAIAAAAAAVAFWLSERVTNDVTWRSVRILSLAERPG